MEWFNIYGLVFIVIIMVPNIIFAIKQKDTSNGKFHNKTVEIIEQIGRYGCFGFMIFNIPATYFGLWFKSAIVVYIVINSFLVALYCIIWMLCWRKNNLFKALSLSIIPSIIFLFSGIMYGSTLLGVSTLLFAPTHIYISYKNIV